MYIASYPLIIAKFQLANTVIRLFHVILSFMVEATLLSTEEVKTDALSAACHRCS